MVTSCFSNPARFAALLAAVLALASAGCSTDNTESFNNSAPLPNLSPRPGLNSADTVNPLNGTGGSTGAGPLSPVGVNGTGSASTGGARGGH